MVHRGQRNTGDTGDIKDKGDKGDTRDKGDTGDTGDTGNSGDTRDKGDKGDIRDRNDTGDSKSIKCQQVHSNKPMSGAGSPSCRPGSVQLNLSKNMIRQTDPYGKAMKK